MTDAEDPCRRLRELLGRPGIIRSMGAHEVLTALLMEEAGFECVFVGGFGARQPWSSTAYGVAEGRGFLIRADPRR